MKQLCFAVIQIGLSTHLDLLTPHRILHIAKHISSLFIPSQDPAGPSDNTEPHGVKRKAGDSDSEPEPEDNVR